MFQLIGIFLFKTRHHTIRDGWYPFGHFKIKDTKTYNIKDERPKRSLKIYTAQDIELTVSGVRPDNVDTADAFHGMFLDVYKIYSGFCNGETVEEPMDFQLFYEVMNNRYMFSYIKGEASLYKLVKDQAAELIKTPTRQNTFSLCIIDDEDYKLNIKDEVDNLVVYVDETSIRLYPVQQTNLVDDVCDKVRAVEESIGCGCHIIIQTWSPFVMMGIPVDGMMFLKPEPETRTAEQFMANIFDVMAKNLDMNSSYGRYASSYVERIKDYAEAGNKCCEADYKCVGDEYLRGYVKRLTKL